MSEEMKNNLNDEELDKEQLENAAGGNDEFEFDEDGHPIQDPMHLKPKKPTEFQKCPVCGAPISPATYGRPIITACPQCGTPYDQ